MKVEQPETRYAISGDLRIAYQVIGEGPLDLVMIPGLVSNVDVLWLDPAYVRAITRLASFARVIVFDKRGTGLSDPTPTVPSIDERMDDVRAVMDAAGSQRAALLGFSEGGPMSIVFAGTYPERVSAMVMVGSLASGRRDPVERPWWETPYEAVMDALDHWGEGRLYAIIAPGAPQTTLMRRMAGLVERASASPAMVRAIIDAVEMIDVTRLAAHVRVPTLILHRTGDRLVPVEHGRELASMMPEARFVEMPGDDHLWYLGDVNGMIEEIEEFLTGSRHHATHERALATVVFADIVGSTERAAELGDHAWRDLLEQHTTAARGTVERFRGRVVKLMGDGLLATFDGPGRAIEAARALVEATRALGLELRVGVHTGECELIGDDVGGMAVHIGARIAGLARPGEVLTSSTVRDVVVGSGRAFSDRGVHTLKGVPGEWRLFAVGRPDPQPAIPDDRGAVPLPSRALLRAARRSPALTARLVEYTRRSRAVSG